MRVSSRSLPTDAQGSYTIAEIRLTSVLCRERRLDLQWQVSTQCPTTQDPRWGK